MLADFVVPLMTFSGGGVTDLVPERLVVPRLGAI